MPTGVTRPSPAGPPPCAPAAAAPARRASGNPGEGPVHTHIRRGVTRTQCRHWAGEGPKKGGNGGTVLSP